MFISNLSTPFHNFCSLFSLAIVFFFKSSGYRSFVSYLLDLGVMSSSHDFSFHFSALNSYIQWPGRKLHLGISQVPQTQFVHRDQQLLPSNLLFLLGSIANFQVWNLSTSLDCYYSWFHFRSWSNPIANLANSTSWGSLEPVHSPSFHVKPLPSR